MKKHIIVRPAQDGESEVMLEWLNLTLGHNCFDVDCLNHDSTFTLAAADTTGPLGFLPVQRPLMMESIALRPGLSESMQALVMTRMTEQVVAEAYRRHAAEVCFLSQNPATSRFAEDHLFGKVQYDFYRLNLRETFGTA